MRGVVVDSEGQQVHVMSAVGHDSKHCYVQKNVGTLPVNGSDERKRTNEIKTVAPMLDAFNIAGGTITADALHTQRAFAEYLVGCAVRAATPRRRKYQPTLLDDVRLWFESLGEPDHEKNDLEHGRIEPRRIWLTSKLNEYLEFPHGGRTWLGSVRRKGN